MPVLYIEPKPGNGEGHLRKTYKRLRKHRQTLSKEIQANYNICVVGFGYPPLFVEVEDSSLVPEIENLVNLACDSSKGSNRNVKIYKSEEFPCHSMQSFYKIAESDSDGDEEAAKGTMSKPQPHEDEETKSRCKEELRKAPPLLPNIVEQPEQANVFVSYNSKDKEVVRKIIDRLEIEDVSFWMDDKNMKPGDIQETIDNAIHKAKVGLIFIGIHGVGSWQNQEAQVFFKNHVEKKKHFIPVVLPKASFPEDKALWGNPKRVEFNEASYSVAQNELMRLISQALVIDTESNVSGQSGGTDDGDTDNGDESHKDEEVDTNKLYNILNNRFSDLQLQELHEKVFADYRGSTHKEAAFKLIAFCRDNNKLEMLEKEARKISPKPFE